MGRLDAEKIALPDGNAQCLTPISDIVKIAQKLWITGTPALVFENGKLVPGEIRHKQIEALLALQKK